MKKHNTYSLLMGILLIPILCISCDDDLNVDPRDKISESDLLNNPAKATQLINGIYDELHDYDMNSFSWIGVTSITSDDADKGSSAGDTGTDKNKLDNLNFASSDISFNAVWKSRYTGIGRANTALFYLDRIPVDPTLKSRLVGEAKFLRALWYFDLVRCFGGVPVVISSDIDVGDSETILNTAYTRKTKQETYLQIEIDLTEAIAKLPLKSQYAPADMGRATKGAAQALLAKVYLYEEKWQQSYDMCGEVISSGQYALLPDYAQVWRETGENGTESIFEVQAIAGNGITDYSYVQEPRGTPDLGWGFNTPSLGLTNSYESGDLRKAATIMFIPSTLWDGFYAPPTLNNPRYNYKAYQSRIAETFTDRSQSGKNLRVLKYSDILLIRAEAGFHIGSTGDALDQVNAIRHRAGLTDATGVTLQSIWNERRHEMAMEHDRWFDIIRTGQALSAMAADGKTFIVGTHELFPIPQEQITASGGRLLQNHGY
jgi:hypothetical protein